MSPSRSTPDPLLPGPTSSTESSDTAPSRLVPAPSRSDTSTTLPVPPSTSHQHTPWSSAQPPTLSTPSPSQSQLPPSQPPLLPSPRTNDTIVNEPVVGLGRTHTIVTPQRTDVIPQLNVNKYQVDVPVPVPTSVERTD